MKTMCPPGYHHNGFVATHALGHMMYGYIHIYYAHLASVDYIAYAKSERNIKLVCWSD